MTPAMFWEGTCPSRCTTERCLKVRTNEVTTLSHFNLGSHQSITLNEDRSMACAYGQRQARWEAHANRTGHVSDTSTNGARIKHTITTLTNQMVFILRGRSLTVALCVVKPPGLKFTYGKAASLLKVGLMPGVAAELPCTTAARPGRVNNVHAGPPGPLVRNQQFLVAVL